MRTAGITCRTQEPLGVDRDVSSNWNGADDAAAVRGQKGRKKAGYEQAVSNQKHGKGFFTRTQKKKKKTQEKTSEATRAAGFYTTLAGCIKYVWNLMSTSNGDYISGQNGTHR